jgi:hypothetical protein
MISSWHRRRGRLLLSILFCWCLANFGEQLRLNIDEAFLQPLDFHARGVISFNMVSPCPAFRFGLGILLASTKRPSPPLDPFLFLLVPRHFRVTAFVSMSMRLFFSPCISTFEALFPLTTRSTVDRSTILVAQSFRPPLLASANVWSRFSCLNILRPFQALLRRSFRGCPKVV